MKKKIALAIAMFAVVASAFASCPPDRPYNCVQLANGKMRCGCGVY
jgi:hypothetical protein